jgi:hypothetical protein
MYIEPICLPCFLKQAVQAAQFSGASEEKIFNLLRESLSFFQKSSWKRTPPELSTELHRFVRKYLGVEDPYLEPKKRSSRLALSLYEKLKDYVRNSSNPLYVAARLALAGNVIDLTFGENFDVFEAVRNSLEEELFLDDFTLFQKKLSHVEQLVFLADNAGETVFDRVFIEEIPVKVYYIVNEKPVLNEATVEDAVISGVDKVAEVISDGTDAVGFIPEISSSESRRLFEEAELLIAKGQANYELLEGKGKPVFYMLKAKCEVVAKSLQVQKGSLVFSSEKRG